MPYGREFWAGTGMRNPKIAARFMPYIREFWAGTGMRNPKIDPRFCRTDGIFAVRTANGGYDFYLLEPETVTIASLNFQAPIQ